MEILPVIIRTFWSLYSTVSNLSVLARTLVGSEILFFSQASSGLIGDNIIVGEYFGKERRDL